MTLSTMIRKMSSGPVSLCLGYLQINRDERFSRGSGEKGGKEGKKIGHAVISF